MHCAIQTRTNHRNLTLTILSTLIMFALCVTMLCGCSSLRQNLEWVRKFSNNTDIDPMNWVVSHIMALEKQIRELEKRPAEYIPE